MPAIVINEFEVVTEPQPQATNRDVTNDPPPSGSSVSVSEIRRAARFIRERERRLRPG